jgi:hypothetical protein
MNPSGVNEPVINGEGSSDVPWTTGSFPEEVTTP